ncbi:CoA ester lyase [Robbsia sp. Bb-Pol-6]|uniref:CoA ester lyase n=1 Tax=Robbsia betulipollinis TaxID=2981849 RepID=A0ABT3ZII4_9BURK|nr:CoA ester lyase [Robbsia betulipollinis]MCY0386177.1 CoA ester lyase [Robbsia betulipollinis]
MTLRSYLFVPGDHTERFAAALATDAHQVVIDLEDGVAHDAKDRAREQLAVWLQTALTDANRGRLVIRVNAPGSPWHDDDLAMFKDTPLHHLMVPKVESAGQLAALSARAGEGAVVIALVESVAGVVQLRDIAQAPGVARLAFGSFEFGVDAGIEGDGSELDAVRTAFVIASRHAGLPAPIDGVTRSHDKPGTTDKADAIAAAVATARRFGFGGKLCLHGSHVEAINHGFAPTDAQREWAARVVAAWTANPQGATAVDGKFIDKAVTDRAKRILAS